MARDYRRALAASVRCRTEHPAHRGLPPALRRRGKGRSPLCVL